jgi:hypothetical protein
VEQLVLTFLIGSSDIASILDNSSHEALSSPVPDPHQLFDKQEDIDSL